MTIDVIDSFYFNYGGGNEIVVVGGQDGGRTLGGGHGGLRGFHCAVDKKHIIMSSKTTDLSPRLAAIVDALPLRPGLRVLEVGCGSGAAARAVAQRVGNGHVLAIDRSAKAVEQAQRGAEAEIAAGRLTVRQAAAEDLVLEDSEALYDIAFVVRVGALDGRHPEAEKQALRRIAVALTPGGRLFIDGGDPLREVLLTDVR